MNLLLSNPVVELPETTYNFPSVSIVLPFEPKMKSKRELTLSLQTALYKIENDLFGQFSMEMTILVLQKLKMVLKDLNYSTHKKSIAIYVSPVFEKVIYLNIEVEEKVMVGTSFHIRDLVKSKKLSREYLLLQLLETESRIYVCESGSLQRIYSGHMGNQMEVASPIMEHTVLFAAPASVKMPAGPCAHPIDAALDMILETYHLPLFVIGNAYLLEQFKTTTAHANAIIDAIETDYVATDFDSIKSIMENQVADWKRVHRKFLFNQLKMASATKKLAKGITDVYRIAMRHNGRLLLVRENYSYPVARGKSEAQLHKAAQPYSRFSYLQDAVDEIIEKVLEEGGDVELVEESLLESNDHIALIL